MNIILDQESIVLIVNIIYKVNVKIPKNNLNQNKIYSYYIL